jgi:AraC-like DNA-binding protein
MEAANEKINQEYDLSKLSVSFQALIGNKGLMYKIFDTLPIPVEIFDPDGTTMYLNRALLDFTSISDVSHEIGKYNVKTDPVCIEVFGKENLERALGGEGGTCPGFTIPSQDLADRGLIDEKPWETATMDFVCQPVWDGDTFVCTICFFVIKTVYHVRTEIAQTQEYMKNNWRDDFDIDKIANTANLSRRHFQRMFKENMGITPAEYYKNIKIEKLKEKLLDPNLNITEAFATCNIEYRSSWVNAFKKATGQSPSEFRKPK